MQKEAEVIVNKINKKITNILMLENPNKQELNQIKDASELMKHNAVFTDYSQQFFVSYINMKNNHAFDDFVVEDLVYVVGNIIKEKYDAMKKFA